MIWKLSPESFMQQHAKEGFRWLSANQHDTARAARTNMTFAGMAAFEALVRFEASAPRELIVSLYNRGDTKQLDESDFQKLLQNVETNLTAWTGMKGILFKTQERTSAAILQRKSWIKEPYRVDLVWSFSEKSQTYGINAPRPEFARLQITPFDPMQDPRKTILATGAPAPLKQLTLMELRTRVKREPNGDVLIPSVPMVDQGQKGYCAAAVAERLLRYYGRSLDQHEIAQLANTTSDGGTTSKDMVAALRRVSTETKMDVAVLYDFDLQAYDLTVADYNLLAKRARKPEVTNKRRDNGFIYVDSISNVYKEMDPTLLREARLKREGKMAEFKAAITKYVNSGVPLAWSCMVGVVKEKLVPQGFGGHMRLIIGYNDRTKEILYTDSWGAGHEVKRFSLADTWTITMGLYSLQPREIRL